MGATHSVSLRIEKMLKLRMADCSSITHQYLVMKAAPAGLEALRLNGFRDPIGESVAAKRRG